MYTIQKICIIVFLVLFSQRVYASVVINEISWQGYGGDANNEWIELFNSGSSTLTLDGWLLESLDGTPSINLTGVSISAGSFVLLERTDDETVPGVAADLLYTGALANTGESLVLKNSEGQTIDSANFSSGWDYPQDMSNTLSRFGNSWGEGIATPKEMNIAIEPGADNDEEDLDGDEQNADEDTEESSSSTKKPEPVMYKTRKVSIVASQYGFVDTPLEFTGHVRDFDGGDMRRGIFIWNLGDGTIFVQPKPDPFTHVYAHPGEYVVSLTFNRAHFGKELDELEPEVVGEFVVQIIDHPIHIESFDHEKIILKNETKQQIDLGGWSLRNSMHTFTIPRRTFVRAGKTLSLAHGRTGIWYGPVSLITPTGEVSVVWDGKDVSDVAYLEEVELRTVSSTIPENGNNNEQMVLGAEDSVTSAESQQFGVSPVQQVSSSVYLALFICIVVFGSLSVWFVVRNTSKNETIDGYTIIEEK